MTPVRLTGMAPRPIVAMPQLVRMNAAGITGLIQEMFSKPADATFFMNQFQLFSTLGNCDFALEMQKKALELETAYRIVPSKAPTVRLLALMTPGDSSENTPLEYLVEDSDIQLDLLYILPGKPLPVAIPEHDVAIVAAGSSSRDALALMERLTSEWPRPVLNPAQCIRRCSRESLCLLLEDIPDLVIPNSAIASRHDLGAANQTFDPPMTIRPLDSQAGRGLARIESSQALAAYLAQSEAAAFHVSRYVEYRSRDGRYRKLRIVLIDGQPFLCHLAIGNDWIVHYGSSGMMESSDKRCEEARLLEHFESDFLPRHRAALGRIAGRLELDYVVIDCAETQDGKLLLFEADNRGWVHATDPVDLFAYKQEPMKRVFSAFREMLIRAKG